MKKNFFLFIALCLAHTGLAQLKVNNVGNAAIGGEPLSNAKLSFYSDNTSPTTYGLYSVLDNYVAHCQYGKSLYGAYFKNKLSDPAGGTSCGTSYGVFIDNDVASYSGHSYGVYVNNKGNHYSGNSYGFYANSTIDGYGGIAYGAYFSASTATSRHTVYGIYSTVSGTNAGNLYAGYFTGGKVVIMNGSVGIGKQPTAGLLDVAGSIAVNGSVVITSDERLKSAIKPLSDEKEKLYLLQGKSYKKTLPPIEVKEDSLSATKKTEEKKELIEFSEYGYLAQELKEVFPDLVSLDSIGYYSVNYIGLIPVIVEALKDQRSENEEKQIQIEKQKSYWLKMKNNRFK